MAVFLDPGGAPVEIGVGRGDLRLSSWPNANLRIDSGMRSLIGGKAVSYGDLFAMQPWVAAAVMRMLTWAVRVPLKAYRRTGDDSRERLRPEDHPLARIIERPWLGRGIGPANQSRLIQNLLGPVLVHGNSVLEIEQVDGEDYLRPLDWRSVTPVGTTLGDELAGWRYTVGNETQDIPIAESLHIGWWSPLGPLGISPLEQLGVTVSIEDAAQRYQQGLFRNGARPPSAITASPEFLTMERTDRSALIEQLRQDVDDIYAGPDSAGKPAVLPPGLDWKPVGHSAVEAALIDQRKISRDEIAAVYQIPPPMMGILESATYSNITTQREMAYTDCLGPPLVLIEQALTTVLARDHFGEDDVYAEFDFGPVLRGDRQKEIDSFRLGIGMGIYTPNEARRALNLQAVDTEGADELWMPKNNLKPMGSEEPTPAKPGATPAAAEPSEGARRLETR